jgi:hypothetical protein
MENFGADYRTRWVGTFEKPEGSRQLYTGLEIVQH